DTEARKIPAGELTPAHFLFVPKPRLDEVPSELDAVELLKPYVGTFRRSARRRVPRAVLRELLVPAGTSGPTSKEIGATWGYHPAYVRTLRSRLRREEVPDDDGFVCNGLSKKTAAYGSRRRREMESRGGSPWARTWHGCLATIVPRDTSLPKRTGPIPAGSSFPSAGRRRTWRSARRR